MSRIAVVSSPRSGNTWVRQVIAGALGWTELAVHNYTDIVEPMPDKCILQIHWYREPNFQRWLDLNSFSVLTVARHPLDILVSVLNYLHFVPETRWLEGNTGLPGNLQGKSPCSKEFLEYALSMGAEDLLAITYQWWQDKRSIRVRYEDALNDPELILGALVSQLGGDSSAVRPLLDQLAISNMQAVKYRHVWQGKAGLWRRLVVPADARAIYHRHRRVFDTLGYKLDAYWLTRSSAEANWRSLTDFNRS